MATTAVVQAHVDEGVKARVQNVLEREGLTLSEAFQVFLERTAQQQALPTEAFHPNAETVEAVAAARRGEVYRVSSFQSLIREVEEEG